MASIKKRTSTRASARASTKTKTKASAKDKGSSLMTYEREVRRELEKKIGKGSFPGDVYSAAYMRIVERAYKSEVHPIAAAGVLTIASGLAPEKAPSGLCCGQR